MSWAFSPLLPGAAQLLNAPSAISGSATLTFGNEAVLGAFNQHGGGVVLSQTRVGFQSNFFETLSGGKASIVSQATGSAALVFGGNATGVSYGLITGSSSLILSGSISIAGILAGGADLSLSATGTPKGLGTLLGSSNVALGGTGALSVSSVLSSAVIAFGGTGTLTGSGSLIGVSSIVFSGTPFLMGYAPVSGVSELIVQQLVTPLLGKIVPISGSSSISFSGTSALSATGRGGVGDVLKPIHSGFDTNWFEVLTPKYRQSPFLTASSQIQFGGVAVLGGAGELIGSSSITFGGTPIIRATGSLVGSGDLVFAGTANVTGGAISGSASITFDAVLSNGLASNEGISITAVGTLTGVGNLQGTSLSTINALATLGVTGMFGSASLSFSASMGPTWRGIGARLRKGFDNLYPYSMASADLSPRNPFTSKLLAVGTTSIVFGASSTLSGQGFITGSASLSFGGTASVEGALSASSSLLFVANATPRADGALVGSGNIAFDGVGLAYNGAPKTASAALQISATGTLIGKGEWIQEVPKSGAWTPQTSTTSGWTKQSSITSSWTKKTGT